MLDIKVLEDNWVQYKKSKRKPYYIFTLLFILVGGILFYTFSLKKEIFTQSVKNVKAINNVVTVTFYQPLLNGSIDSLELEKRVIPVSFNNANTISPDLNEIIPTLPVINKIPVIDTVRTDTEDKKKIQTPERKRNIFVEKSHKKVHLNITKSSSQSAYEEVEKRFNQLQDPDDSLFLAKSYYAKKEYKKSEYWALRTNKLDNDIEESWIIFVKSKIKLGYKKDAIHILSNYVKQSNSQEAKILLLKLNR